MDLIIIDNSLGDYLCRLHFKTMHKSYTSMVMSENNDGHHFKFLK